MNDSIELPALVAMSIDDEVKAEAMDHPVVSVDFDAFAAPLSSSLSPAFHDKCFLLPNA